MEKPAQAEAAAAKTTVAAAEEAKVPSNDVENTQTKETRSSTSAAATPATDANKVKPPDKKKRLCFSMYWLHGTKLFHGNPHAI